MIWQIEAADAETGKDVTIEIEAMNERDALSVAKGRGLLVCKLTQKPMPPPEPPRVLQQPVPIPVPVIQYDSPQQTDKSGSVVLGVIALIAWIIPIVGFPIAICGLVTSLKQKSDGGVAMSVVGLVLTVINAIIGMMMATGRW